MSSGPSTRHPRLVFAAKTIFRLTILALVGWGIWWTFEKAQRDLEGKNFSLANVDAVWLAAAGVGYLIGLAPMWWFWHQTLCAFGQEPDWRRSLRAHYIGHVGKYVPGKALVVVLRSDLVGGPKVDRTAAAVAVFVETLTMMAVGATVGAALLAVLNANQPWLLALGAALAIAATVPTMPPVCRFVVRLLQVNRANPRIDAAVAGLNWRLLLRAWPSIAAGWLLMGASLWAVLQSMPAMGQPALQLSDLPLLIAAVTLATALGFLSLIPGGLGVREMVIIPLLAPRFTVAAAAVAAVLLRLVWLVSEGLISIILYWVVRAPAESARDA